MNKKGFTLVEVVAYIAIYSTIILVVVNLGVFLARESQISISRNQLISESRKSMDDVTRLMRAGTTINSGSSTLDAPYSSIHFQNISGDTIYISANESMKTLGYQVNSGSLVDIHSKNTHLERLFIERINPSTSTEIYSIQAVFSNSFGDSISLQTAINFVHV